MEMELTPFERAHRFTSRWEGGYVFHPDDPGGATNLGISLRFLRGLGIAGCSDAGGRAAPHVRPSSSGKPAGERADAVPGIRAARAAGRKAAGERIRAFDFDEEAYAALAGDPSALDGDVDGDGRIGLEDVKAIRPFLAAAFLRRHFWDAVPLDGLASRRPLCAQVIYDTAVNMGLRTAVRLAQKAVGARVDGVFGPQTLAAFLRCRDRRTAEAICHLRRGRYAELASATPRLRVFLKGWLDRTDALEAEIAAAPSLPAGAAKGEGPTSGHGGLDEGREGGGV